MPVAAETSFHARSRWIMEASISHPCRMYHSSCHLARRARPVPVVWMLAAMR